MKSVFSVLLMILSLLISFQQGIMMTHFKINQHTLEDKYCINKNKPALQCHGTCFLRKKLQEAEEANSEAVQVYQSVYMLPVTFIVFEVQHLAITIQLKEPRYKEIIYKEPYPEIQVPPPIVFAVSRT